jgi:hypothetical protein
MTSGITEKKDPPRERTQGKAPSRALIFGIAVAVAALGPSITNPRERAAKAPFSYVPPSGFVPSDAPQPAAANQSAKMWTLPRTLGFAPRITLTHTEKKGAIDDAQLREVARGMPSVYRESQVTWTEVRHEVHTRADRTLVGVVYGDGKRDADGVTLRTVQMLFPDDAGTSLLTVSYGVDDSTHLDEQLLQSADAATGVALRGPGPPSWLYGAWGGGGLVLAIMVSGFFRRKST